MNEHQKYINENQLSDMIGVALSTCETTEAKVGASPTSNWGDLSAMTSTTSLSLWNPIKSGQKNIVRANNENQLRWMGTTETQDELKTAFFTGQLKRKGGRWHSKKLN